jgi:hypothetical protein
VCCTAAAMFPIVRYPSELSALGVEVLTTGRLPGPPSPPHEVGVGYPLAFDVCGRIAAVSFAALDVYPDIALGWWCLVEQFSCSDGTWGAAGGEHDNTTSATPFERPTSEENSNLDWLDWVSFGGACEWDEEPRRRQSYFGIALVRTARLTVTVEHGCERELRVTPWNGAFVVASPGTHSLLTGYDVEDNVLGMLATGD